MAQWNPKQVPRVEDLYRELQPNDTKFFDALERQRNERESRLRAHAEKHAALFAKFPAGK